MMVTKLCGFIHLFFSSKRSEHFYTFRISVLMVIKLWSPRYHITWEIVSKAKWVWPTPAGTKLEALGSRGPAMWLCVRYIKYTGTLPACRSVHHMHTWYPWKPERVRWPRTRVTGGCKLGMKIWSSERAASTRNNWDRLLPSSSMF